MIIGGNYFKGGDRINNSEIISNFLDFLKESQRQYDFCHETVNTLDKATQDYLHALELGGLKCAERSKVATQLANCRKKRREGKDSVEELQPLIDFIAEPENKKVIEKLKKVLGEVRKQERNHKNRHYVPRVVKEEISEL